MKTGCSNKAVLMALGKSQHQEIILPAPLVDVVSKIAMERHECD